MRLVLFSPECPILRGRYSFVLSNQPLTFQTAEKKCASMGGTLAQIISPEDRNFFQDFVKRKYFQGEKDHVKSGVVSLIIDKNSRANSRNFLVVLVFYC